MYYKPNDVRVFVLPISECVEDLKRLHPESRGFDEYNFIDLAFEKGKVYSSVREFQKDLNKGLIKTEISMMYFTQMEGSEFGGYVMQKEGK